MKRLKAEHWFSDALDEPVVLFQDIVQVFRLDNADDPANTCESENDVDTLQTSEISAAPIDGDVPGDTAGANGTLEKPTRGRCIAVFRQHKFKGLAVAINCAVQISRFATHPDVSFVDPP